MVTVTELVAAQRRRVRGMSCSELLGSLDGEVTIVDVREPDEVATTGTIPGAIRVPRGTIEFKADPTSPVYEPSIDPRAPTVVYCATGGRSTLAAGALLDLGYDEVSYLDGGIGAWIAAGYPVDPTCGVGRVNRSPVT